MKRRLFSVWDWSDGMYRYYAGPTRLDQGEDPMPPPSRPAIRPPLGDPPDQLARELPAGSVYVGSGQLALGEIAVRAPLEGVPALLAHWPSGGTRTGVTSNASTQSMTEVHP